MSLINKMLQDLERRQDGGAAAPVYQDLRPVHASHARSMKPLALLAAVALTAVIGVAVYVQWLPLHVTERAVADKATTSPTVSLAELKPKPAPASEPALPTQPASPPPTAPETTSAPAVGSAAPEVAANVAMAHVAPPTGEAKDDVPVLATERPPVEAAIPKHPIAVTTQVAVTEPRGSPAKSVTEPSGATLDKKIRPLSSEETAETHYRQAARLIEQGRAEDAMRELRTALEAQPLHRKARELLAGLSLQAGRWRDAEQTLEQGLRLTPRHYAFGQLLARIEVERGNEAKAVQVLEAVAPYAAGDAEYMSFLGALYQRGGRHADAIKAYTQAVTLRPAEARSWLGLGISLEAEQQWRAAAEAYERARAIGLPPSLTDFAQQRIAAIKTR